MAIPTGFFRWWIRDERTGKRRRTTYKMTCADANERFPGAEPDLQSREVHSLPMPGELGGNWKPPPKTAKGVDAQVAGLSPCAEARPDDEPRH